jgi:carbamoyltransferase
LRTTGPAAVHADGTARLQRVTADDHPLLHAILTEHHALTGGLALLNTSFNLHEEPIVQGPEDALRSWRQAGLDALLLGDTLIERGA